MIRTIEKAFIGGFKDRYDNILKQYYPAHDSTGFTERNLTCNFANSLIDELNDPDTFIWYEVPLPIIKKGKCQHVDTVVFSQKNNSVFFIEAKRLGDRPSRKRKSIENDINRLVNIDKVLPLTDNLEINNREHIFKKWEIENKSTINQYFICLADFWEDKVKKDDAKSVFLKVSYNKDLIIEPKCFSELSSFKKTDDCVDKYNIFLWAVKIKTF